MFTINLEKSLIARKSNSIYTNKEQLVLDEANAILEKNVDSDIDVLKQMGLDYSVKEKESIERKKEYLKGLDRSRIFTEDEIKSLCVSYRLKFLRINSYRGSIDPNLPDRIKEFKTMFEASGHGSRRMDYYDFMICAPKESFKLEEHPVDPLLFYPVGGGFYYLVHKWGNDISILRWIKSLKMRSFTSWAVVNTLQYWTPLALLAVFVLNWHWGLSFLFLGGALVHFLIARYFEGDYNQSWLERRVTKLNWNNNRTM